MPKFIWVVEITTAKRLSNIKEIDRKILGEIIIDPTANPEGFPYISIHFPGILFVRDIEKKQVRGLLSPIHINDYPYNHPSRSISN